MNHMKKVLLKLLNSHEEHFVIFGKNKWLYFKQEKPLASNLCEKTAGRLIR